MVATSPLPAIIRAINLTNLYMWSYLYPKCNRDYSMVYSAECYQKITEVVAMNISYKIFANFIP